MSGAMISLEQSVRNLKAENDRLRLEIANLKAQLIRENPTETIFQAKQLQEIQTAAELIENFR